MQDRKIADLFNPQAIERIYCGNFFKKLKYGGCFEFYSKCKKKTHEIASISFTMREKIYFIKIYYPHCIKPIYLAQLKKISLSKNGGHVKFRIVGKGVETHNLCYLYNGARKNNIVKSFTTRVSE